MIRRCTISLTIQILTPISTTIRESITYSLS